jgi:competence protein ComEA
MAMLGIPSLARRRKILLATGLFILGTIILVAWYAGRSTPAALSSDAIDPGGNQVASVDDIAPDDQATPDRPLVPSATPLPELAIVYISGAVQHPDVYQVPAAARVKDVVMAAGGLAEDAATDQVNLAEHIVDAQHIHIPRQGETSPDPAPTGESATADHQDGPLNINTASAADLDGLPGIGQSIAQRIVEYRTANGPFQSAEDLQKVKGIGPALFAKIASLITVGP